MKGQQPTEIKLARYGQAFQTHVHAPWRYVLSYHIDVMGGEDEETHSWTYRTLEEALAHAAELLTPR